MEVFARCANLLKLPDYVSYESLKTKVLQAIRLGHGELNFRPAHCQGYIQLFRGVSFRALI